MPASNRARPAAFHRNKRNIHMLRRTKIVATLGPATDSPESLASIIKAGVDVTRLNFSHGSADEHIARARRVREAAAAQGRFVALLADLQGPKLRIARFTDNKVFLEAGQTFVLDAAMDKEAGNAERVGIDYEQLINDVKAGDILVLDDGRIEMEVRSEEHTSELQSRPHLVCRLLLEKKKKKRYNDIRETASSPNKNQTFRRTSSSRS